MNKRFLAVILMITTLAGTSITAAAEGATLTFTGEKELVYSGVTTSGGNVDLGTAFEGVAPGETRTQTITLVNDNGQTADFYMSTEVLRALEETREQAAGAGYDIVLTAAGTELYNSTLGGYGAESSGGSREGLKAMNDSALSGDVLVATLGKGESTQITLQIHFDGEAMDSSAGAVDYSNAMGEVGFGFKVGYQDATGVVREDKVVTEKGETRYVTRIVEERLPLAAKTGDNAMILGGLVVLAAGIVLLVLTGKKRAEG